MAGPFKKMAEPLKDNHFEQIEEEILENG